MRKLLSILGLILTTAAWGQWILGKKGNGTDLLTFCDWGRIFGLRQPLHDFLGRGIMGRYQRGQHRSGFLNRSNQRIHFGPCRRIGGKVFC